MGLFSWPRQKKIPKTRRQIAPYAPSDPPGMSDALIEIAKQVGCQDALLDTVSRFAYDIPGFYGTHTEWFQERGLERSDPRIPWFGLICILEANGYVCERDWKDELEDFVYFLGNLQNTKAYGLTVDPAWFRPEGDIVEWCTILRKKWGRYVVAAFDINSDSYVLFPCHVDFFPRVEMLGRIVGGMFGIVGRG